MNSSTIIKLIIALALPLIFGAIAGLFTAKAVPEWYATLNRPSFNPPNSIFGPVWSALYIIMGISLFMIWKLPNSSERNIALFVFYMQLLLNFGWSFLFFYFKTIGFAFVEIIVLWVCIIIMMILFYKLKPIAAYINIPCFLWVSFATVLNAAYYKLN